MNKGIKIFLFAFIISLPFWWGANILEDSLDDFFYAQLSHPLENLIEMPENTVRIDIKAKSAISVRADKEEIQRVLFKKDIDKVLPIASLTKLMTALVVVENPGIYDSSYNDLSLSMLIASNNEAAESLASIMGREKFIDLMNQKARELNLRKTEFFNPTGLDPGDLSQPKNYSTVEDLTKLAHYILIHHLEIFKITSQQNQVVSAQESLHLAANRNDLLDPSSDIIKEDSWWLNEILAKIVGGKTGYTLEAGGCLLLILQENEDTYFIDVVLGADSIESRFIEMKKLVKALSR